MEQQPEEPAEVIARAATAESVFNEIMEREVIEESQIMHATGAQSIDEDESSLPPQLEGVSVSMQQELRIAVPQMNDSWLARPMADEDETDDPDYVPSSEPTDDEITTEESSDGSSDDDSNDETMQLGSQLATSGIIRPTKISEAKTKRVSRRATKPPRRGPKKAAKANVNKVQQSSKTIRKLAKKPDAPPMAVAAAHANRSVQINERRHPPSQILPQSTDRAAKLKVQAAMIKQVKPAKMTKANPPKKSTKRRRRRPANASRSMRKVQATSKAIKKKPSRRINSRKPSKAAKRAPRKK